MRNDMIIRLFGFGMYILPMCFLTLLLIIRAPNFWEYFIAEQSPLAWLHSLMLYTIGILGCLLSFQKAYTNKPRSKLFWWIFFTGFIFLSIDERFAVHERLRDRILAPKEINVFIFPWTNYGDFLLLLLFFISALILFIFRDVVKHELVSDRALHSKHFKLSLIFAFSSVILDSVPFERMGLHALYMMQTVEEFLETLCFSALLFFLIHKLHSTYKAVR